MSSIRRGTPRAKKGAGERYDGTSSRLPEWKPPPPAVTGPALTSLEQLDQDTRAKLAALLDRSKESAAPGSHRRVLSSSEMEQLPASARLEIELARGSIPRAPAAARGDELAARSSAEVIAPLPALIASKAIDRLDDDAAPREVLAAALAAMEAERAERERRDQSLASILQQPHPSRVDEEPAPRRVSTPDAHTPRGAASAGDARRTRLPAGARRARTPAKGARASKKTKNERARRSGRRPGRPRRAISKSRAELLAKCARDAPGCEPRPFSDFVYGLRNQIMNDPTGQAAMRALATAKEAGIPNVDRALKAALGFNRKRRRKIGAFRARAIVACFLIVSYSADWSTKAKGYAGKTEGFTCLQLRSLFVSPITGEIPSRGAFAATSWGEDRDSDDDTGYLTALDRAGCWRRQQPRTDAGPGYKADPRYVGRVRFYDKNGNPRRCAFRVFWIYGAAGPPPDHPAATRH